MRKEKNSFKAEFKKYEGLYRKYHRKDGYLCGMEQNRATTINQCNAIWKQFFDFVYDHYRSEQGHFGWYTGIIANQSWQRGLKEGTNERYKQILSGQY